MVLVKASERASALSGRPHLYTELPTKEDKTYHPTPSKLIRYLAIVVVAGARFLSCTLFASNEYFIFAQGA